MPTDLGPAGGHQFRFSVTVQGSYTVVGDPRHYDSDPGTIGEPFTLTVRAWSLTRACRVAAETPFGLWTHPCDDCEPSGNEPGPGSDVLGARPDGAPDTKGTS